MQQVFPRPPINKKQMFAMFVQPFSLLARSFIARQLPSICIMLAGFMLNGCTGTLLLNSSESATSLNHFSAELDAKYPVISVSEGLKEHTVPVDGEDALIFKLVYLDGLIIDSSMLRGRPILLNFWATWCSPCRREMPEIVSQSNANKELIVIAINEMEMVEQIQPFVEEFQMEMIVARDINGEIGKTFGLQGLPKSIFIDRNGRIVASWVGYLSEERLQELLSKIL